MDSCLGTILVLATVAMVTVAGQRTYMRTCECEYTENGQCAYTLLLPLMGDQSDVCPKSGDGRSAVSAELESRVNALYETLQDVSGNITRLGLWSGDQSRMLSQLQSKVMDHTDQLQDLMTSSNVTSRDECALCSTLEVTVHEHSAIIRDVNREVESLAANITHIQMQLENLKLNSTRLETAVSDIEAMNQTVSSLHHTLSDALQQIETKLTSFQLCTQKGLLVSGNSLRVETEAISVSSEMANSSAQMVRISTQEGATAWCPEEPNSEFEWVQFDLGVTRSIYGVVTKGRADYAQWVTSYKVQYGESMDDLMTFQDVVGDEQTFTGNLDQNTAQTHMLWQPISARYVRFVPLDSHAGRNKCLRADVIGCLDV